MDIYRKQFVVWGRLGYRYYLDIYQETGLSKVMYLARTLAYTHKNSSNHTMYQLETAMNDQYTASTLRMQVKYM